MLWLRGKEASGKTELIASELDKLFDHLLSPLGVKRRPSSIADAIASYQDARDQAEQQFGVAVRRDLAVAAAPAFASLRPRHPRREGPSLVNPAFGSEDDYGAPLARFFTRVERRDTGGQVVWLTRADLQAYLNAYVELARPMTAPPGPYSFVATRRNCVWIAERSC